MTMIGEKYKVLHSLGKGNMGSVFLVEDVILQKKYAMKIVGKDSKEKIDALMAEAKCLKSLTDRRLPYVVDVVEEETLAAIVMEYVEGISLEEYLSKNAPLPEEEALGMLKEIAGMLAYLHSRRPAIVFRDLKPANIILQPDKKLRLLDFGAALEGFGEIKDAVMLGTYGYSAPEQVKGCGVTPATDIYALGAIYFYMLTGVNPALPPYRIGDVRTISLTVSEESCQIVDKCCHAVPEKRYANGQVLVEELEEACFGKEEKRAKMQLHFYYTFFFAVAAYAGIILLQMLFVTRASYEGGVIALLLIIICLFWRKSILQKYRRKRFIKKREWNILYTEKKMVGLWGLVFMIFISTGCVKQENQPFYLDVVNENGGHVLVRDGSFFETEDVLNFSLPVEEGSVYEVYFYQRREGELFPEERFFRFGK